MRVGVVGCGYVGLISGLGLASAGHQVVGVEQDAARRRSLETGVPPFYEPGLEELLRAQLGLGRFSVVPRVADAARADVYLLAVQTPLGADGAIDLRFVHDAVTEVAAAVADRSPPPVVAVRSTVVPGTARELASRFGRNAVVASNPEFLQEGSAVRDFLQPDRIVLGCDDARGREVLRELYAPLGASLVFLTPTAAELTKYASNALLATLISFANELGGVAESLPDVDVEDVLGAVALDRRLTPTIGGELVRPGILSYLKAGCGYGGSCLPKDLAALIASARAQGTHHPLLEAVRELNERQPGRLVDAAERVLGGIDGRTATVLGAAFKGGTDDLRASPGLKILEELLERGAQATLFDPLVAPASLGEWARRGARIVGSLESAVASADVVLVTTDAPEFDRLAELVRDTGTVVVDGRRRLRPEDFDDHGYVAVGRSGGSAAAAA
jgi:UDPglucose 6-dehydrogenase